ncbi:hypothetical protein HPB51_013478 [Rhipicephalus microplus]|uniref:Uncharacterized protein n=1 Tax=Rhipicephalus microplus TaxID=6941 RepID=A0A9J6ENC0_RHIMP|nr:hypothetical protein HPB51_013478 [Rhipicephalus microplus]
MHNPGTSNDRFVLRSSSEYSTIVHHVKLKTQRPAVRRAMSPIWLVNSSGLIEHQTMYQQHQQQMSRCEELCSLMGTVSLGTDSARQWNSRPARHTQSRTRPAAGPPLYPIDPRDRERTYLEETWLRRRLARVKCCLGHLDRTSRLQWTADSLEKEKTRIESALSDVHDELLRMTHVFVGSQTRSCHAHHSDANSNMGITTLESVNGANVFFFLHFPGATRRNRNDTSRTKFEMINLFSDMRADTDTERGVALTLRGQLIDARREIAGLQRQVLVAE